MKRKRSVIIPMNQLIIQSSISPPKEFVVNLQPYVELYKKKNRYNLSPYLYSIYSQNKLVKHHI